MTHSVLGHGMVVPIERRIGTGVSHRLEGIWRSEHASRGARRAWRTWAAAGGLRAMAEECAVADRIRDARMVLAIEGFAQARPAAVMAQAAADWLSRYDPRTAVYRQRGMGKQRRRLDNAMVAAGMAADGRGRWAVEQIVNQVGQWVKIRWVGFNPRSGQPWPVEWVHRDRLTPDLREQTRLRRPPQPRAKRPVPEQQADGAPRKRTPRVAGELPGPGLP